MFTLLSGQLGTAQLGRAQLGRFQSAQVVTPIPTTVNSVNLRVIQYPDYFEWLNYKARKK